MRCMRPPTTHAQGRAPPLMSIGRMVVRGPYIAHQVSKAASRGQTAAGVEILTDACAAKRRRSDGDEKDLGASAILASVAGLLELYGFFDDGVAFDHVKSKVGFWQGVKSDGKKWNTTMLCGLPTRPTRVPHPHSLPARAQVRPHACMHVHGQGQ